MPISKEMVRFSIAGALVGATDFGVYYLLIHFLSFSLSKGISFAGAGIVAYLFNKYWTFQGRTSSYSQTSHYLMINFLALGINIIVNQWVLNFWAGAVFPALIVSSMSSGLFTFIFFKWWVFKKCRR